MNESKIAHLGFVQGAINRMAGNSLTLKSVAMALVTAVVAFAGAVANFDDRIVFGALLPVLLFWVLDARYLQLERQFRKLYDAIRKDEDVPEFDMNPSPYKPKVASIARIAISWSVIWYYLALGLVVCATAITI